MKFDTFRNYALALMAALLVAACGGGGASRNPNDGGPISVSPSEGTFYAGQKATITLSGGRRPYSITSSEPGILPVPPIVDGNSFDVVPNNPGVVDVGLPPGSLPVRTVIISVRDSTGILVEASIRVAQNFLTGYNLFFDSSTCTGDSPCAGGETAIILSVTTNGSLHGLRKMRFERVRGPFQFVDPLNTNILTDSVIVDSDHEGKITAVIRVTGGVPSQIGVIRVTDVASGVSVLHNFTISGTAATASLTLIPDTLSFVGATSAQCGTGSGDVLVFDGQAPYKAICPNPNILVRSEGGPLGAEATSTTNPGRFTFTAGNPNVCLAAEECVITDASGARATIAITTTRGPAPTPPPAMSVAPNTITLGCGASGSVTVVGGSGSYSANSNHPRVTAVVSGNTVTITRLIGDAAAPGAPWPATAIISVTDGATIQQVTATVPTGGC